MTTSPGHQTERHIAGRRWPRLLAGAFIAVGLLAGVPGLAGAQGTGDDWRSIDGPSLGVTTPTGSDGWCEADAGAFHLADPVEACS
ncbi:MAG: hypothetical protein WBM50_07265 [Acidimicrobiales bacterium]